MLQFHSNRMWGLAFDFHGMAIPEAAGLKLVYRQADNPVEVLAEDCQKCILKWQDIQEVQIKRGFFGGTVTIAVKDGDDWQELPFYRKGVVALEVHKSNFQDLKPFEREIDRLRRGADEEDVDDVIDDVRDFLDGMYGDFDDDKK